MSTATSKLSDEAVFCILEEYFFRDAKVKALAEEYGMRDSTVRNLLKGYRRKDVYEQFRAVYPELQLPPANAPKWGKQLTENDVEAVAQRVVELLK